ncbi:hypothetical protein AB0M39_40930 [Streptomyces sp. NPDC051907]|uniref:hypothetical protein n=1 Tax=Streptomyces sp. NPDC051907 TaxID=3155284 RepID=UPI003437A5EF
MKQDEDEHTRTLWSHKELAKGMGLSRGHLYRLLENGHMIGPDVVVAKDNLGWEPKRARRFGADADRLDADGHPRNLPAAEGSLAKAATLVKSTYSVTPSVYLSSWLASYAYGLSKQAVYFMRERNAFIPADVAVGQGRYRKYGWAEPRVIEFGEQTGRLNDDGIDLWVVRRTAEFGLSPDIAWVQQRLAERPGLTSRVERALEAWRESQEAA